MALAWLRSRTEEGQRIPSRRLPHRVPQRLLALFIEHARLLSPCSIPRSGFLPFRSVSFPMTPLVARSSAIHLARCSPNSRGAARTTRVLTGEEPGHAAEGWIRAWLLGSRRVWANPAEIKQRFGSTVDFVGDTPIRAFWHNRACSLVCAPPSDCRDRRREAICAEDRRD